MWKPISTVPKTEDTILVWQPCAWRKADGTAVPGPGLTTGKALSQWGYSLGSIHATHWMPLPPPPALCRCGLHPQEEDNYCPAEQTARECSHSEE